MVSHYTNLPVNTIVRLPHPRSGDSQGQKMFLLPSADKQTCNYDRVVKPPPFLSTLRSKGLSHSKMKFQPYIQICHYLQVFNQCKNITLKGSRYNSNHKNINIIQIYLYISCTHARTHTNI